MTTIHHIKAGITNCYILQDEGAVLVDTGTAGHEETIVEGLKQIGLKPEDINLILLTHAHYDHLGSADTLKIATGAPIAVHLADAPAAASGVRHIPPAQSGRSALVRLIFSLVSPWTRFDPVIADVSLSDGHDLKEYGVNARVIHTPGHSPGSITILTDNGDALVGDVLVNKGLLSEPVFVDKLDQLHESIEHIKNLDIQKLYPGHGDPFNVTDMQNILPGRLQVFWWIT